MKDYELTVAFHPDLEMNLDPAIDKVEKIIENQGGKIIKSENDGKKRMNYVIKGQNFAIYYFFVVSLPPEAPAKISSNLNIADEVLRYLLVKADKAQSEANSQPDTKDDDSQNQSNEEKGE